MGVDRVLVNAFDTRSVPAADRFDHWVDLGCRSLMPAWVRSDHENDFRAWLRLVDLGGGVQVSAMAYPSVRVRRPEALVRRSDPEAYQVNLILDGHTTLCQGEREVSLGSNHFVLFDSSRPFHGWRSCSPDVTTAIVVQIPRAMLALSANAADRLTAVPIPATTGVGAVFARWLVALNQRAEELTPADGHALASVTAGLLTAVLAHHDDTHLARSPHPPHDVLRCIRDRACPSPRSRPPTACPCDSCTGSSNGRASRCRPGSARSACATAAET